MRLGLLIAVRAGTAIVVSSAAVQFWGLAVRGETPRLTPSLALPPTATAIAAVDVRRAKHGEREQKAPEPARALPSAVVPAVPASPPPPARTPKPGSEASPSGPTPHVARPKIRPPAPPAVQPQVVTPPIVPQIAPAPPAPTAPPSTDEQQPPHSHLQIVPPDLHGQTSTAAAGDEHRHEDDTHAKRHRT